MSEDNIKKMISQIVGDMTCIFTGWRQAAIPGEEAEWAKGYRRQLLAAIQESGISDISEIEKGMAMARKSTSSFMPGVGQFVEWCKPADKNASKAWQGVIRRLEKLGDSQPFENADIAVCEAVEAIGGWNRLCTLTYPQINELEKQFCDNYNETKTAIQQLANEVKKLEH